MSFFYNFQELDAPSMYQKPGKGKSKKIHGGACPGAPMETWSLGPSLEIDQYQEPNPSVFILVRPLCIFR